jgi:hypothetical protein
MRRWDRSNGFETPFIGTNVPAFPDHNQFKAGIFPPKDPDSIAYAVIRLFSTLGPETIDRGIQGSRAIGITLPKKRLPLTISFFGNSIDRKPASVK